MDISVHDNLIYGYLVNSDESKIILYTEYLDSSAEEYTDVVFSGVKAHYFDCVLFGRSNIILDISQQNPIQIYHQQETFFSGLKNYGWPFEYQSNYDLRQQLENDKIKGFIIWSSLGLSGWVWATDMEFLSRESKKKFT